MKDPRIDLPATPSIEAAAGDNPKFTMTAYNGGRLLIAGYRFPVIVDLSSLKIARSSLPVHRDHDTSKIVGHTTAVQIINGKIEVSGVLSGANEHAREVRESSVNGFPWESSVGARPGRVELVQAGAKIKVNGREFEGPVYVARGAVLGEISFVSRGGDEDGATARVAAQRRREMLFGKKNQQQQNGETVPVEFADDETAIEAELMEAREIQAAEAERCATIHKICAAAQQYDLEAEAIRSGWTPQQTKLAVLRASRQSPAFEPVGGGNPQSTGATIEAALLMAGGIEASAVAKFYDEQTVDRATGREFRDHSIHSLLEQTLRAAGRRHSGGHGDSFIKAALEADREIRAASGGFSTLAISNILENVAHKTLLAAYNAQNVVWPRICGVRNLQNFRPHSMYRLDPSGSYKKVGPTGELQHVSLTDAKYTVQADTFGAIIALTRPDMRNDDLDAFMQIPTLLGRMGAIRVEEAVFALILANTGSFFSSGNANLMEAGSALAIDTLTTGKAKFRKLVTPNGKPVLISPKILLVPAALETPARVLVRSEKIIDGSSTAAQGDANPHVGTLDIAVSPYIDNTDITDQDGNALSGQSDTQWYLFANPAVRAAIHIGFLDGQRAPRVESSETDFSTLGMQWRAYHDFGVAFADPVAAVKATGAGGGG